MTMSKFIEIGNNGKCPSCFGSNLRKCPPSSQGGIHSYTCDDCNGFPSFCNSTGNGIVYVSHDRTVCSVCGEVPDSMTHALVLAC